MTELHTFDYASKEVPVNLIELDLENPRYNDKRIERGSKNWTDAELQKIIEDEDVSEIVDSIREHGVMDPIWVVEKAKNRYQVIEGSRRLVALRGLIKQGGKPPKGVKYDHVKANVLSKNISKKEIDAQRVILQTGKKDWGPFNVASAIYNLVNNDHYSVEEVATMMGKSGSFIKKELENFKLYREFTIYQKNKNLEQDPRKYTYFQRAGNAVRDKFFGTRKQKEEFFGLITPNKDGITRIPSVSLRGGLFHFNTLAQNENILKKFLKNKKMTVDDGLEEYRGKTIQSSLPWLKKLKDVVIGLNQLGEEDKDRIKNDNVIFGQIKRLYLSSKTIVDSK
jgi:ParB/RepB/Spo0J family partition protein